MSRRYLHRKTAEMVVWSAIEGQLSLEEAAREFVGCYWGEDAVADIIAGADVVEQLACNPPDNPKERAELEQKVSAFFWAWLDDQTAPWEPQQIKSYPL